ncbi:lipid A export permease/ATP-binding protein MsbA [Amphibiibacter pelophylacis]|uniref:Lipid A export permease/ATP-binding protein MsbA n=1 Tax=Amphibiibacter pelophylacis TaxID=1799477 RepID=A0ACC6P4F5_9BURK
MSRWTDDFRRIAPYFRGARKGLIAAALGAGVGALTEPLVAALLQPLLDHGFGQSRGLPVWGVPVVLLALFAVRGLASFVAQYSLSWTAAQGVFNLRQAMFERLMRGSGTLFTSRSASSLTNTLVYEVQSGSAQLVGALITLVRDSLTLLALTGYLLYLNWQLTLFVAVMLPCLALAMRLIGRRMRRLAEQSQTATDDLAYVVEENVLAWKSVRLHEAQDSQRARFESRSLALRRVFLKGVAAAASTTPISQMLAALAISSVLSVALWQSQGSGGSVGEFVSFVTAMLMLVSPIKHLSDISGPINNGLAAVIRGVNLVDSFPDEASGAHAPGQRARGELLLEGVGLRYADHSLALEDITLRVQPGQTVALVGASGAGKTSLVQLLPRLLEPSGGRILLDGVPLADWDLGVLRRQFALVSQDVVLLNDTLAGNIAMRPVPPDSPPELIARVQDALQAAHLAEFAAGLPQGLHTPLGHNGNQLSGGQRQRVAIARALFKDAPILILDEATSALDSASERAVQQALERLRQGRTTIVIAHRLSTIEHADVIVMMAHGRIIEQGAHAALLQARGAYAQMHALQFGAAPDSTA